MNKLQIEILRHILMFRITVPAAVAAVFGISDQRVAHALLEKLRDLKYLGSADLTGNTDYYFLLPRAAEPLGSETVPAGPINATPKVEHYATLYFCCLAGTHRPLLDAATFRTRFPTLYRPGPTINYYTEGRKLGYIRVDTQANTAGDVGRVITRCEKDVDKRRRRWLKNQKTWEVYPEFEELITSGRFVVTVLTAFQQKASRIHTDLNRLRERYHQFQISKAKREKQKPEFVEENTFKEFRKLGKREKPPRLPPPIEVHAIPGLLDLMYPKPARKDSQ